jgi:hypothetical protein
MSEGVKRAVELVTLRLLESLARISLAAGIGVGDLANLAKVAFVRVAREQGERNGESRDKPNISRISVVTGLTRVEVGAILEAGDGRPNLSERGKHRAERVLSGWWHDPAFQTPTGEPAMLPLRGKRRSFAALCAKYSGERSRTAPTLQELIRVGAVKKRPDGLLQAISRTYATVRWDPDGITSVGHQLGEHCETLLHNLENPHNPRLALSIGNPRFDPKYVPVLRRFVEEQAAAFAEGLDNALNDTQYTVSAKSADSSTVNLGVGLYFFFDEHCHSSGDRASGHQLADERPRVRKAAKK